ncbi:MAG: cytidylate kinase-like family protein [Deltaproteobacteria bacterium]|jgi:cytidylate kinase
MPLITVTTSIGCGAIEVSRKVADDLKIELYDDQRLQQEALSMGYSSEDLKGFDEKAPGLFDRLLRRRPEIYNELMAAVIYEVAHRDEGVIIGHGAAYFLKDFSCALHLRMHTSEQFRIRRLMDQLKISRETALNMIKNRDNELKTFLDFLFQIDWNDFSLYDLVINVDKLGIDTAAEMIVKIAQAESVRECSLTALESMEKLSLLKKVEAAVMRDNINPQELQIDVPQPGVVKLTGLISPMRTAAGITELIKSVAGVEKVICEADQHPLAEL